MQQRGRQLNEACILRVQRGPWGQLFAFALLAACGRSSPSKEQPIIQLSQRADDAMVPPRDAEPNNSSPVHVPESTMIRVPTTSFLMGADDGMENERPMHKETVHEFLIDTYEVTTAEFEACVAARACSGPRIEAKRDSLCNIGHADRQNHPVNCIDWHQANAFCKWVGKRLPTEAEWELAARGARAHKYPWGNTPPSSQFCWKKEGTCQIDQFPRDRSVLGVMGMAGNVSEWTASTSSASNPQEHSDRRVARGGSWDTRNPAFMRASVRDPHPVSWELSNLGMRCARDAP